MEIDVVMAGAGHVGCATALALDALGLSVCLVDPKPFATNPVQDWDVRVFTLSPGSERFLEELGVWSRLDATRRASVYRMQVFGDAPASTITFDAMRTGVERLATIVEGSRLQAALESRVRETSIKVLTPASIRSIDWRRNMVQVGLADARSMDCRLVVGADGTDSLVRSQARIGLHYRGYGQQGVVANFQAEKAHRGRAFQWFREDGVLAFLPLPGQLLSIVWSTNTDHASRLLSLDASELVAQVEAASGRVLGGLTLVTKARAFPLRYARAHSMIARRVALVGDAAHSVHPLAGQGVNLGMRDAQALAGVLKERPHGADVGESECLTRYQRARREDTMSVFAVTDGLQKLFATSSPLLRTLRNQGMNMVDWLSPAKHALVRRALL